ncbi:MAG TPA: nitroreductase family deazaflavin-dependent oxidoreductase [Kineosporiaceae bacterium]|nr:nitroreductase family deazaflavin-dependent oxidoreductase [Kineosporiaceae bacterium]
MSDLTDSPVSWVAEHTRRYLESGGEDGHEWRPGVPTLLLTTTGRKSGVQRRTALIYGRDTADYVVVASKGGSPEQPAWYLNLEADPEVEIQVLDKVVPATARTVHGAERERLWALMREIWPAYDQYQTKTDREIPVVVLTPRP